MKTGEFEKVLTLSTGHLRPETDKYLTEAKDGDLPFRFVAHEYGYILFMRDGLKEKEEQDIIIDKVPELYFIIRFALKNSVSIINFDRDAAEINKFRIFEW